MKCSSGNTADHHVFLAPKEEIIFETLTIEFSERFYLVSTSVGTTSLNQMSAKRLIMIRHGGSLMAIMTGGGSIFALFKR